MTTHDDEDVLLRALRELPRPPVGGAADERQRREARAAFVRAAAGGSWYARASGGIGRVAVPVVLASVIGVYLSWAIAAVNALAH